MTKSKQKNRPWRKKAATEPYIQENKFTTAMKENKTVIRINYI